MSFFGDIVNSIGSDKAPPPPQKPLSRPNSANTGRALNNATKSAPRPGSQPISSASIGMKRKADNELSMVNTKASKSIPPNEPIARRAAAPPLHAPKPQHSKPSTAQTPLMDKTASSPMSKPASTSDTTITKPNSKGSYAEMMARARQSAEQRTQSQIGTIRHQETKKDKMSRLADRRKTGQDRVKASKPGSNVKQDARQTVSRSASPMKKDAPEATKPPSAPPKPTYKGTMGMAASRSRSQSTGQRGAKKARYDEYLGTDEEDNSDLPDDEEDGYGSDASSDMEAGYDDVEMEEAQALKAAKMADAEEMALENKLKREKEERRKKLMELAAKRK